MKKSILILPTIILCSCVRPVHYPYIGEKTITGQGGFLETFIPVEQIGKSVFGKKSDYEYDGVVFFMSGLPVGEKCTLKGYVAEPTTNEVAKSAMKLNANVATKSTVRFPISFDNNTGQLDGTGNASDWYNGYGDKVAKGYNIFECK